MISSFTQTIIAILLIPCIPLLIYVIGILIPESHIVSRTITYKTRPERLWHLLTHVQQYPSWRPKLDKVAIDSITEATLDEGKRVVFVEHSKRHRRTVILHVEQQPLKTMLRVLEERITTAVSLRSPVPTRPHVPTFSGSWTFELKYPDQNLPNNTNTNKSASQVVQLKITEQGVIKKPLVRLSNMLLFGYHRRIDRFMKDLEKKIEQDQVIDHDISNSDTLTAATTTTIGDGGDGQENGQRVEGNRSQQQSADNDNSCTGATHDEGQVTQSLLNNNLLNMDLDTSMYDTNEIDSTTEEQQQPSRSLEKDWDLVSEIYERQKA